MSMRHKNNFRQLFPLINQSSINTKLVYFDNAATTQKPKQVIDAVHRYYCQYNANVHRSSHQLSTQATLAFEQARIDVQTFINASFSEEIIWTKGATESINLVAMSWGLNNLLPNDEIVLSYGEHHANIVPWQQVAKLTGAKIKVLPLTKQGIIDISSLSDVITSRCKMVAINHISNVIGKINPIEKVIKQAQLQGAKTLIDGSQAAAHISIDVQQLNCDFYVFSAHKMFGPTGVGVLYGKRDILNAMPPYQTGGEMIKKVSFEQTQFNDLPFKFEAGTPNIANIIAFSEAISLLKNNELQVTEEMLLNHAYRELQSIPELSFVANGKPDIPLFSFTIQHHHNQDISAALNNKGIAVRVGHHCAMPLMEYLNLSGCIRVSLAPYNTLQEISYFIEQLKLLLVNEKEDAKKITNNDGEPDSNIPTEEEVLTQFSAIKSWDGRHRQIMLLGKRLPPLHSDKKIENNLIQGCESKAWLDFSINSQGRFQFYVDSDAKIIKGLLVIVLSAFNLKTAATILQYDIKKYFDSLGLIQHLSPSRANGLTAIVNRIQQIAKEQGKSLQRR